MLVSTGIEGLDSIMGGGIPRGHIVSIFGAYGTGKTTFGLHFVEAGLKNGENCVFISLDEDEQSIVETAVGFGMDFNHYPGTLKVIQLDPVVVKESLMKTGTELLNSIRSLKASRVVFDTVSVLEGMFDERDRWVALASLRNIVKQTGATAIFTSESERFNQDSSKYGIIEYISDGAIILRYLKKNVGEEPSLVLQVIKMRRMKHSRKPVPYIITDRGIAVLEGSEIF